MIGSSHLVKGQHEVKGIPVNRGERSYEAQVDDEDYEFLSQYAGVSAAVAEQRMRTPLSRLKTATNVYLCIEWYLGTLRRNGVFPTAYFP